MTCGGCFKNGLIKDVNETRGRFMVTSADTWDQKSELESYQSKFSTDLLTELFIYSR